MWENMSINRFQQRRVPGGVRPDRVRDLRGGYRGGQQAGPAGSVGHGRPGGLRPAPAAVLPGHRRHPHVLLRGQPGLAGKHPRKVGPGSQTLLPERADHLSGQQEGSPQRRERTERTVPVEAGAGEGGGRPRHGHAHRRI